MSTCARNLPQHFNGCACTPSLGGVTAEAADVDLVDERATFHQVMEESIAWDDLQHAEISVAISEDELARYRDRPRVFQRQKRLTELTTGLDQARSRADEARAKQEAEQDRLDAIRPSDEVKAAEQDLMVAHRRSQITRVGVGLATKGLVLADNGRDRRRAQIEVDHFERLGSEAYEGLKRARKQKSRSLADASPTDGTSIFDTY